MYSYLHIFTVFGVTLIPFAQGCRSHSECKREVMKADLSFMNLILTWSKSSIALTPMFWRHRSNNRTNMYSKPHACWQTGFLIPNHVKPNRVETDINSYDKCEVFDRLELSGLRSNFSASVMSLCQKCNLDHNFEP